MTNSAKVTADYTRSVDNALIASNGHNAGRSRRQALVVDQAHLRSQLLARRNTIHRKPATAEFRGDHGCGLPRLTVTRLELYRNAET